MLAPGLGKNRSRCLLLLTAWGAMLPLPSGIHAPASKRPVKIDVSDENEAENLRIRRLLGNIGGRP